MSDWLDTFQMMGVELNEGEKSLMRFAMGKERNRIIKLLEEHTYYGQDGWLEFSDKALTRSDLEALIKGEQK